MKKIIGVDEVGRGALSGPIVAAALRVVNPRTFPKALVADSKTLTDQKRRALLPLIEESCEIHYGVVSNHIIDRIGIQAANVLVIDVALSGFGELERCHIRADHVAGYSRYTWFAYPIHFYVRGEDRFSEIAAASIVAKVFRDNLMIRFEKKYPGYGFAQHKGYGTRVHKTALFSWGALPIHRQSFLGT